MTLHLYGKAFNSYSHKLDESELFIYIRDEITTCPEFGKIHTFIIKTF